MNKFAKVIRMFSENPKFTIENKLYNFKGRPNSVLYFPKVNYDKLTEFYGLRPNDFREKVAILANSEELMTKRPDYRVNWVTSVDVRAANERKLGEIEPFFQLAAIGVTITKDNQIVLGIRGGEITPERIQQYASGLYGAAPAGSVTFKPEYDADPITDTLYNEFHEEVGNFEIYCSKTLGVFEAYRPGPVGIKFVGKLKTDATLKQVQQINTEANKLENKLKSKGATRKEINLELENRGLPKDAWEHTPIIGIQNDKYAIEKFLEMQTNRLSGICVGALEIYKN
ncbi:hypothetical protein HY449_02460 [Candidatus Pacearchaeota archaeon]|nr:hypothetical protein [Candidatus Pacearchaeota archaeon]